MDARSVNSRGSRASSGRYRSRAPNSQVDESLFGNTGHPKKSAHGEEKPPAKAGAVSRAALNKLTRGKGGGANVPVTVVSRNQINDIKARSVILKPSDIEARKEEAKQTRLQKRAKAEARKTRMRELEAERKARDEPSDFELGKMEQKNKLLAKAEQQVLEQDDMVKTMRRKMAYAQCAKIREEQIKEKEELRTAKKAYEERMDILMEIDRLEDLQRAEEKEEQAAKRQADDANEIRAQINARVKQQLFENELLEQEKLQMKQVEREQERAVRAAAIVKREQNKKLLEDVLLANKDAMRRKELVKVQEAEDDARIVAFNQQKQRLEQERYEEEQRLERKKEQEFWANFDKIKQQQEMSSDIDAQRARRYQQEKDRKDAETTAARKKKVADMNADLKQARLEQQERKLHNMKVLALLDKREHERIQQEVGEIQGKADAEERRKNREATLHQKALREQMLRNEEKQKEEVELSRAEGRRIERETKSYLAKIERQKQKILDEMRESKIPEKFCAEVASMPIKLN